MKTVYVLVLDGVMDSSLGILTDTLRAAEVRVVLLGQKAISTGGGLRLTTALRLDTALVRPRPHDWLVIPGLGLRTEAAIAERLAQRDAVAAMAFLRALGPTQIAAACSSVFLLAASGLLTGRRVTMTWWLAQAFRQRHPQLQLDEAQMLVRDGPFLTCGSAFAILDLALAIVADVMGERAAYLCSRYLLIDQRPSQARYMMRNHVRQADPTVIAAERWIDAHLAQPISVTALAAELAVTPKTLARRIAAATGMAPLKFIQQRRLLQAAHLIEGGKLSIESVAAAVGYQDATALRKLIKREFGKTPTALRG